MLDILEHFKATVLTDLNLFITTQNELHDSEEDTVKSIVERIKKLRINDLKIDAYAEKFKTSPAGSDDPTQSSLTPVQCQLRAQRERDLKGNPLVYKAWKRATPSLQDDCDDAW